MNRLLAPLLTIALLVSCDGPFDRPFTPALYVNAIALLEDGPGYPGRLEYIVVNRTYAIDEEYEAEFPGAQVSVSWRGRSYEYEHWEKDRYVLKDTSRVRPVSLDTLGLAVSMDGYDTVFGRTVVPGGFDISWPRPGDTVTLRDSLVWTRGDGIAGFLISADIQFGDQYFAFVYPNDTLPLSTQLFFLSGLPEGERTFYIVGLDRNYYNWARRGTGGPGGFNTADSFDLVGGAGVFGSGFQRSVRFCFRCDSTESLPPMSLPPGAFPVPRERATLLRQRQLYQQEIVPGPGEGRVPGDQQPLPSLVPRD